MRPTPESTRLQMDAQARAQQLRTQMDQVRDDALKAAPELQWIADKLTPPELFARAQTLWQLKAVRRDPSGTLGTTEAIRQWGPIKQNIEYVMTLLSTEADPKKFENTIFNSYFLWWDSPGNANVAIIKPTRMSVIRFLGSFVNDAQIVSSIFSKPRETSEGLDATKIWQILNLSEFLLALEVRNPGAKYKKMFLSAQTALQNKDLKEAMKVASFVQDEWNIDLNSVLTKEGKQKALRAIWAVQEASKASMSAAKEMTTARDTLSPQQTSLVKELMENLERQRWIAEKWAQDKYAQMLAQIPTDNPLYYQIARNKTAVIDELKNEAAYLQIVDGYIKKNWSKWLGPLLESYDDMKWLYGWNISDESAKMTKEWIIMLASFVVTAGIWPLLGAAWVLARAWVAASAARAAELAEAWHKIKAWYYVAQEAVLKWGAVAAEYGTRGAALHERNKYTSRATETWATLGQRVAGGSIRIAGESAKFTLADTLIRAGWRSPGETSPYDSMLENFMRNGVMFAAFGGMEKYVSWPWKDKALKALKALNIKNPKATFIVWNTVLTAGDVAAMWVLWVAETGEFHIPNTYEMLQALAFRVGMKWTEQLPALIKEKFPRLSEKYDEAKKTWAMSKIADEINRVNLTPPKIWKGREMAYDNGVNIGEQRNTYRDPSNGAMPKIPEFLISKTNTGGEVRWLDAKWNGNGEKMLSNGERHIWEFRDGVMVNGRLENPQGDLYIGTRSTDGLPRDGILTKWDGTIMEIQNGSLVRTISSEQIRRDIESMRPWDQVIVVTENNSLVFERLPSDQWYRLISATNPLLTPHIWTITPNIGYIWGNRWFIADSLISHTSRVQRIEFNPSTWARQSQSRWSEALPKYHGEADKFIISKNNKSDLPIFQKDWYDLTSLWFDGWNVKQSQKKGKVTYILSHPEHGTHSFSKPKEVQDFLRDGHNVQIVPAEIWQNIAVSSRGVNPEEYVSARSALESRFSRTEFRKWQRSGDANVENFSISGEGIPGLEGVQVTRIKRAWAWTNTDSLYEISYNGKKSQQLTYEQMMEWLRQIQQRRIHISNTHKSPEVSQGQILNVPSQAQLRWFIWNPKVGIVVPLDATGLSGWTVRKLPQWSARSNNVYELLQPGKPPQTIEWKDALIKSIQEQARQQQWTRLSEDVWELFKPQEVILWLENSTVLTPRRWWFSEWFDANGRPIDMRAKARIEREHELDWSRPRMKQSDILGGSFRTEIEAMMKLDDATFQNRFTDAQNWKWKEGNRPYEAEMYEWAANVRKLSDAEVIKNASALDLNRRAMGEMNQKNAAIQKTRETLSKDKQDLVAIEGDTPADLMKKKVLEDRIAAGENLLKNLEANSNPSSLKARTIAENAALRLRLKEIIWKRDPAAAAIAEDPAAAAAAIKDEKNWKRWLALGLIPLILGALWLALKERNPDTTVAPPGPDDAGSPDAAADHCQKCSDAALSEIKYNRPSDANNRIILDEKRRKNISKRWMSTNTWKDVIQLFNTHRAAVNQDSSETQNVASSLDAVLKDPTVANVQALQRCIGMADKDDKAAQDGILWPITTGNLKKVITSCIRK